MTDAELDRALRALTAIDADPGFATRVVAAIEHGESDRSARPGWTLLVPATAAALVVIAIGAGWRATQPVALPPAAPAPALAVAQLVAHGPLPPDDLIVVRPASARRTISVPRDEPWPYRLARIERTEPLAIARIDRTPIRPPRLGIEPLSIAQLEVESLDR